MQAYIFFFKMMFSELSIYHSLDLAVIVKGMLFSEMYLRNWNTRNSEVWMDSRDRMLTLVSMFDQMVQ
jgi:hypothetical protein